MKKLFPLLLAAGLMLCASRSAMAFCYNEAGARYHVDPQLLRSISKVESGRHSVTLDISQKLAAALDLELTVLVALTVSRDTHRTPREILLASLAEVEALDLSDAILSPESGSKVPLNVLSAREKWQAVQAHTTQR